MTFATAATARAQCGVEVEHAMLDAGVPGPRLTTPEGAAVLGSSYSVQVTQAQPFSLGVILFGGVENAVFDPLTLTTIHVGSPFKLRLFATNAGGESSSTAAGSPPPRWRSARRSATSTRTATWTS